MKRMNVAVTLLAVATTILFVVYYKQVYHVRDLTPPEITADAIQIQSTINYTTDELIKGIRAVDEKDGDVTDSLVVESVKWAKDNIFNVTYAACDHSYNVMKYTRQVELTDYTPPRFAIHQPLRFPLGTEDSEILSIFEAYDCIDGDISTMVKLEETNGERKVDGIYNIKVFVTNSLKQTVRLSVPVEFYTDSYDKRAYYPNIVLTDYLVYIDRNSDFKPKSYLDHLKLGNDYYVFSSTGGSKVVGEPEPNAVRKKTQDGQTITGTIHMSAIHMSTDLDTSVPGTYTVTFSCITEDKYSGSTQMTVIVV